MTKEFQKSLEVSYAIFDKEKHEPRCFVACCAFYKGRLLVVGVNSLRTDPNNLRNPLYCRRTGERIPKAGSCAEFSAFKRLKNTTNIDFSRITFINVRVTRQMKIANSYPCSSCANLYKYLNPKGVFYTTDTGGFEEYTV